MSGVDWRAALGDVVVLGAQINPIPLILATRVPQLCQTCEGSGKVRNQAWMTRGVVWTDCPDCPTVERLLAIGAAVWTARGVAGYAGDRMVSLTALKAVKP